MSIPNTTKINSSLSTQTEDFLGRISAEMAIEPLPKYLIVLIRHGFSCANRFKDGTKILGGFRQQFAYPASALTGYGIKQAYDFGHDFIGKLHNKCITSRYIYSSNLLRAMETAKYICDGTPLFEFDV